MTDYTILLIVFLAVGIFAGWYAYTHSDNSKPKG